MQSKQWTVRGETAPKKAKSAPSAGKVTATVFWNSHGVIFIDHIDKGKTIAGAYYDSLLDQLKAGVEEKIPHLQKKKNLVSPGLCFMPHIIGSQGENLRITVRTA